MSTFILLVHFGGAFFVCQKRGGDVFRKCYFQHSFNLHTMIDGCVILFALTISDALTGAGEI